MQITKTKITSLEFTKCKSSRVQKGSGGINSTRVQELYELCVLTSVSSGQKGLVGFLNGDIQGTAIRLNKNGHIISGHHRCEVVKRLISDGLLSPTTQLNVIVLGVDSEADSTELVIGDNFATNTKNKSQQLTHYSTDFGLKISHPIIDIFSKHSKKYGNVVSKTVKDSLIRYLSEFFYQNKSELIALDSTGRCNITGARLYQQRRTIKDILETSRRRVDFSIKNYTNALVVLDQTIEALYEIFSQNKKGLHPIAFKGAFANVFVSLLLRTGNIRTNALATKEFLRMSKTFCKKLNHFQKEYNIDPEKEESRLLGAALGETFYVDSN